MLNGAEMLKAGVLVVGGPITRWAHEEAVRLSAPRELVDLAKPAASVCHGRKQMGRPMMAMMTKKNLGPVRHAIAQMAVGGTMVVQPPIVVRVPERAGAIGAGASPPQEVAQTAR